MGVHIDMPETHSVACARIKAQKVWSLIPIKYIECLEQNQQISSCCRHPENHDIEALFSCPEEAEKGTPDIYIFHCDGCGRMHRRFCIGGSNPETGEGMRPFWSVR